MPTVYLGVGSNENRKPNIRSGLRALEELYGSIRVSPIYESESVGFVGDSFLNLVVAIESDCSVGQISKALKKIEDNHGRSRCMKIDSPRSLDIDILLYDQLVGEIEGVVLPRKEILLNAFVLRPLADLAPDVLHPEAKTSFSELWAAYDKPQKLWEVSL